MQLGNQQSQSENRQNDSQYDQGAPSSVDASLMDRHVCRDVPSCSGPIETTVATEPDATSALGHITSEPDWHPTPISGRCGDAIKGGVGRSKHSNRVSPLSPGSCPGAPGTGWQCQNRAGNASQRTHTVGAGGSYTQKVPVRMGAPQMATQLTVHDLDVTDRLPNPTGDRLAGPLCGVKARTLPPAQADRSAHSESRRSRSWCA
jgi:hypothetical protein